MKNLLQNKILPLALLLFGALLFGSWGFFAHKKINRMAVFTVPEPLIGFYKKHIDFIEEHAVDADKRRYLVADEACHHYLDADHYEALVPIDTIPHHWKAAVEKYTEDSLDAYGIVPWYAELMVNRLTKAFADKNEKYILRLSADLGHYIADACVPLHSTENYNGQLSGQEGIHAFFESRLPELFFDDFDFFVGPAEYLPDVNASIWITFEESFRAKDSVLQIEKQLSAQFPDDKKYVMESKGSTLVKNYSRQYSRAYNNAMAGLVERRMQAAVHLVASLWYTAWVNAGQPDLDNMPVETPTQQELEQQKQENNSYNNGKIIGRPEE